VLDRNEGRYHGYPSFGDVAKVILLLPFYAARDAVKKIFKKDVKKKG
jgi:hypothetical protein